MKGSIHAMYIVLDGCIMHACMKWNIYVEYDHSPQLGPWSGQLGNSHSGIDPFLSFCLEQKYTMFGTEL
jgi:hypothetical protein